MDELQRERDRPLSPGIPEKEPDSDQIQSLSVHQFLSDQDNFFGSQSRFLENPRFPQKWQFPSSSDRCTERRATSGLRKEP